MHEFFKKLVSNKFSHFSPTLKSYICRSANRAQNGSSENGKESRGVTRELHMKRNARARSLPARKNLSISDVFRGEDCIYSFAQISRVE